MKKKSQRLKYYLNSFRENQMYFNAIDNASVMMELVPLMMQQSNMPYRKPSSTTAI